MKTAILFFLFSTSFLFGQIREVEVTKPEVIGKISGMGITYVELSKKDNIYTFLYKDEKFTKINEYKSFSFEDVDGALDDFYNILKSGIEAKETNSKRIEIPNGTLDLEFKKQVGTFYVEIFHTSKAGVVGKVQWLDIKRLNKLFGK